MMINQNSQSRHFHWVGVNVKIIHDAFKLCFVCFQPAQRKQFQPFLQILLIYDVGFNRDHISLKLPERLGFVHLFFYIDANSWCFETTKIIHFILCFLGNTLLKWTYAIFFFACLSTCLSQKLSCLSQISLCMKLALCNVFKLGSQISLKCTCIFSSVDNADRFI